MPTDRHRLGRPANPAAAWREEPVVVGAGDPEGQQDLAGQGGVARVVPPPQAELAGPRGVTLSVRVGDPADVRTQARCLGPQAPVGSVGQHQLDAWLRAERELVGVVALHRPVPVEVVGGQGGHGDHA